jgi:two-component system NtrC family response regulator
MRVILIDDEENLLFVLSDQLKAEGCEVYTASDPGTGIELVFEVRPDVVVTDLNMPGMDGMAVTKKLKQESPYTPVVVLTAIAEVGKAVQAIKAGAVDYLIKGVATEELILTLRRAVAERKQMLECIYLRDEMSFRLGYLDFVGQSQEAVEVRDKIERTAASNAPVILTGESGAGKELVARLIHRKSIRGQKPFLVLNCREESEAFLMEDLFGRATGKGAVGKSKFELADEGALLLKDPAALPIEVQASLQRTIASGLVEPGGGRRPFRVDVRFYVSTSEDLHEAVTEGRLLKELYHSLQVVGLNLPSLSDRREDIPLLAQHFLRRRELQTYQRKFEFSPEALQVLSQYEWPGNVRELFNTIEGAMVMSIDGMIKISDLPAEVVEQSKSGRSSTSFIGLREKLIAEERRLIVKALERNEYVQNRAAKSLGISRSLLNQKIKKLGIELQ